MTLGKLRLRANFLCSASLSVPFRLNKEKIKLSPKFSVASYRKSFFPVQAESIRCCIYMYICMYVFCICQDEIRLLGESHWLLTVAEGSGNLFPFVYSLNPYSAQRMDLEDCQLLEGAEVYCKGNITAGINLCMKLKHHSLVSYPCCRRLV